MKFIKWKLLVVTCLVCLLPILLGVALWNDLPDTVAIHFNIYNEPDNFASKEFAVFGIPFLMVALQIFCCFINDINANKHGERKTFERVTKWIIPIMSILLQTATIVYALGYSIDIRKFAALIVSAVLIAIGNYLPKFDYIKDYNLETDKARKINRFIGFATVIMGILSLITVFLPPIATIVWLFLLIIYAFICTVYGIITVKK